MANTPTDRPAQSGHRVLRSALASFALSSAVALVVLSAGAILLSRHLAEDSALREARSTCITIAHGIAGPLVDSRVREGDPEAMRRLGSVLAERMEAGSIAHVKLWNQDGEVIWSDEEDLVGQTFDLEPAQMALFGTTDVVAEVSDLEKEENVQEKSEEEELLEVYAGTLDADGRPLVVEAYYTTQLVRDREWEYAREVLPVTLGVLVVFQIAILPLSVGLARRVERGERDRSRMMRHALMSSHRERRRIAQDLHDGVIQDLAGLRYAMPMVAARLRTDAEADDARATIARADEILKRDVESLRSMLIDIYPPNLAQDGLAAATVDLAQQAQQSGTEVTLDVPAQEDWSLDAARLAYRVLQEGVRNVVRHAGAGSAVARVARHGSQLHVEVADDGRGIEPGITAAEGHMGLQLLRDTIEDFGGGLTLGPGPTGGTLLSARIPADLVVE